MKCGAAVSGEAPAPDVSSCGFRHDAFLYAGDGEFLDGASAFIDEGLSAGEAALVMVGPAKIDLLRRRLGAAAARVEFADMERVGRNPARIIPAWRELLAGQPPERHARGIGEPVWAGRGQPELVEAQHHEALLNVAFADTPTLSLLCPYDLDALAPTEIDEARRTHPRVQRLGRTDPSVSYLQLPPRAKPLSGPLPEPDGAPPELWFGPGGLHEVRDRVEDEATRAGLDPGRAADLVLAADEIAANSIRHGGGSGRLRVWDDGRAVICEIRDAGTVGDAMVGRNRPRLLARTGRGVWLANQLCDLVQLRSSPAGTVVRLAMRHRD